MPELPEVETIRIGIAPYVIGKQVIDVIIRDPRLRWPVPRQLKRNLTGHTIRKLDRRAKYLLFYLESGCMLLHLGMSGSLHMVENNTPVEKHDHVDIVFNSGRTLRFRDPRRFGSIHWTKNNPLEYKLLNHLGPEPLSDNLDGNYLFNKSRKRTQTIKAFIMDGRNVAGVGNIYANESLFAAGIHPKRKAGKVSRARYEKLSRQIKNILNQALAKGGTTLRDFVNGEGKPGYFRNELQVYNRGGQPCLTCNTIIKTSRENQRSTFYCTSCQH